MTRLQLLCVASGVAVIGVAVLVSQPLGPPPRDGEPLPAGAWLSGLLLAWSPTLALFAWFREATRGDREPLGSSTSRQIGRAVIGKTSLAAALPAVALARGELLAAFGIGALIYLTAYAYLAGQQRLRRPLSATAWTDRSLDQLRLRLDLLPVGALWAVVFVAAGAADEGERQFAFDAAAAIAFLTAFAVYEGPLLGLPMPGHWQRWLMLVTAAGCVAAFVLLPPGTSATLGLPVAAALTVFEHARCATVRGRVAELREAGLTEELSARYGPMLASASYQRTP